MEEKMIVCKLITPMFSFGAYQDTPELQTTELKGAMRYVYRIVCLSKLGTLKNDEAELFGSAAGSGQSVGHASPIRLQICGKIEYKAGELLLHKSKPMKCFPTGDLIITASFNQVVFGEESMLRHKVDLGWYVDLIKLSLIFCGMGRRTRKGRGCFETEDLVSKDKQHMLEWICSTLNKIASVSSQKPDGIYKINKEIITFTAECCDRRPVVQKIWAGRKMEGGQIRSYLKRVDWACHDLKAGNLSIPTKEITGNPGRKFASPLLIRIVKTRDGYYPLYILIKGVFRGDIIDGDCSQRIKFIQVLERRIEGGKR